MSSGPSTTGDPGRATPHGGPTPPALTTSVRRPRRFWYVIGAALIAMGVTAGITLFVVALVQLMDRAPADNHTFANNGSTTAHIDAGASKTVYVTNSTFSPSMSCTAANASGGVNPGLSPYGANITLANWRALFTVSAHDDGDYVISCSGPVSDARFGVGDHISGGEIAYPFIGAAVGGVFVVAGIVVLSVTVVRRSRSARPELYH
jgi:hypothetical protein